MAGRRGAEPTLEPTGWNSEGLWSSVQTSGETEAQKAMTLCRCMSPCACIVAPTRPLHPSHTNVPLCASHQAMPSSSLHLPHCDCPSSPGGPALCSLVYPPLPQTHTPCGLREQHSWCVLRRPVKAPAAHKEKLRIATGLT